MTVGTGSKNNSPNRKKEIQTLKVDKRTSESAKESATESNKAVKQHDTVSSRSSTSPNKARASESSASDSGSRAASKTYGCPYSDKSPSDDEIEAIIDECMRDNFISEIQNI